MVKYPISQTSEMVLQFGYSVVESAVETVVDSVVEWHKVVVLLLHSWVECLGVGWWDVEQDEDHQT